MVQPKPVRAIAITGGAEYRLQHVRVLANQVRSLQEGRDVFNEISSVTDRQLDVTLAFRGVVPHDDHLRQAVRKQRPVVGACPCSRSSMAFKNPARKTDRWPLPRVAAGHLEFFVERLIQSRRGCMEMPA
jgi:flagellar biosynthesis protein FlhG